MEILHYSLSNHYIIILDMEILLRLFHPGFFSRFRARVSLPFFLIKICLHTVTLSFTTLLPNCRLPHKPTYTFFSFSSDGQILMFIAQRFRWNYDPFYVDYNAETHRRSTRLPIDPSKFYWYSGF